MPFYSRLSSDNNVAGDSIRAIALEEVSCDTGLAKGSNIMESKQKDREDGYSDFNVAVNHSKSNHTGIVGFKDVNDVTTDLNAVVVESTLLRKNGKNTSGKCRRKKRLAVETKDVCFKYRSSPNLILSDVSIQIPEGTM